jgi:hypothetical protein
MAPRRAIVRCLTRLSLTALVVAAAAVAALELGIRALYAYAF